MFLGFSGITPHTRAAQSSPFRHVGRVFHIATVPSIRSLAISWPIAVWIVPRGDQATRVPQADILGKNLVTGHQLVVNGTGTAVSSVAISGAFVVWLDCRRCKSTAGLPGYSNTVIVARDLRMGRTVQVSPSGGEPERPAIDGSITVWSDRGGISG
jgi:hypothetical protein